MLIATSNNILKDILVAIDFGTATPLIMKQVIELSCNEDTTIHLLHISEIKTYGAKRFSRKTLEIADENESADTIKKLKQWRLCLQEAIPHNKVKGYLLTGEVHQCIVDVAKNIRPQLIIIGKPRKTGRLHFYKPLNADELSRISKCPVLTILKNDSHARMKTILLPVRNFIPVRKMELLVIFAKVYRARIILVASQGNFFRKEKERNILLETYRVLRNGLNNKVEYRLIDGHNFPRSIAACAEETGADILIVNPVKETLLSGIFRKGIIDILPSDSRLKILSVVPYHEM